MLLSPAEKYRKLIPLFNHAVKIATQINAVFGSFNQLISVPNSLFTIPIVGCSIIWKIIAAELDAIAIGSAYAVLKARIPGKVRLQRTAVTNPNSILTVTTITTKINVTAKLL